MLRDMHTDQSWSGFRSEFERAARRPEPRPCALPEIPEALRPPLWRSLARFQVGEAGEGRIAREIDHVRLRGIDDDYRACLKLMVSEEKRHGRALALLVDALGGGLLVQTWTERLFVGGRRLLGVRLKLLVLLAAEVIGLGFYGLLAERLPPGALARALREICADESRHLRLHCAFFRGQARGVLSRLLFRAAWWAVGGAACAVVLLDHRPALRALGVPLREVAARLLGLLAAAGRSVTRPRPAARAAAPGAA
jgi:hypothetical protein